MDFRHSGGSNDHMDTRPLSAEITSGLTNGQEIVSGGYRAISRDLQDGSKVKKGALVVEASK